MSQQAERQQQGELTVGHQTNSANKSDLNKSPKDQHNIDQAFIFQGPLRDLDSTSPVAFEFVMNNYQNSTKAKAPSKNLDTSINLSQRLTQREPHHHISDVEDLVGDLGYWAPKRFHILGSKYRKPKTAELKGLQEQ